MKKNLIIAAGVLAVLAIYPASSWYFGKQTEEIVQQKMENFGKALPFIKQVQNDYEREFFSSRQTLAFEIPLPAPKAEESPDDDEESPDKAPAPRSMGSMRLIAKTDIRHGPLYEAGGFKAARATTVLEFDTLRFPGRPFDQETDKAIREKLRQAFGDKAIMTSQSLLDFGGGGHTTLTIPEFRFIFTEAAEQATLSSSGLQLNAEFDKGMQRYSLRGTLPRITIESGQENKARATLSGFELSADQQRLFPDDPLSYTGPQKLSIAAINFESSKSEVSKIALEKINMDMDTPVSGEFIDLIARLAVASLRVGERDFGPVAYDYSIKHLRARTLIDLNREFMTLWFANPEAIQQALSPIKEKSIALLLEEGARIAIDRLSFNLPEGELRFSASLGVVGARPDDFDNPFLLAGKLDASAELSLPAAAVETLLKLRNRRGHDAPTGAETRAAEERIANLVRLGYVNLDAGTLKSNLTLKAGQLTINGKPFNPLAAMAQAQKSAPEEEEEETQEPQEAQEQAQEEPQAQEPETPEQGKAQPES